MSVIPDDVAAIAWKTKVDDLTTDRKALVRYVKVYGEYAKAWIRYYEEDEEDAPDFAPVEKAWQALSQELRDEISKDESILKDGRWPFT